ncbi:MAG TPA: helix-turn-helix domain-containing protein, partial [Albitalea sp.]
IRDVAFPCRQRRCLTQALHFVDKADAVAPVQGPRPAPARSAPLDDGPAAGEDGITRIGPTRHLPARPPHAAEPPEEPAGERDRLIWAMEQCGWVQAKAARLLRVTPRQLGYALHKHQIEVRKF